MSYVVQIARLARVARFVRAATIAAAGAALLVGARSITAQPAKQPQSAQSAQSAQPVHSRESATVRPVANTVPAEGAKAPNAGANAGRRPSAAAKAPNANKPLTVTIEREVYSYAVAGRRDPFKSLLTATELRPMLAELKLVAVAYDPTGGNSVAILREPATKAQHRVRVGTQLGRLRVAAIRQKQVVFTIEELGYSRQETLGLNDSTAVRSK